MALMSKYPLIECKDHPGDPLPGYIVCLHAAANPKITLAPIQRATKEEIGVVVCEACGEKPELPEQHVTTACAHYVAEVFGIPL
jgi:hypothetical protein